MTQPALPFAGVEASPPPPRHRCPCGGALVPLYTAHFRCSRCGKAEWVDKA